MMGFSEPLDEFRDLHERAKSATLGPPGLAKYHALRDELAHLLLSSHHAALLPRQRQRRVLRVARTLQVDIEFRHGTVRAMTLDVSSGGLGGLFEGTPSVGEKARITLCLPDDPPLRATARVVAVKQQVGIAGASFQFIDLDETGIERLEVYVFDAILGQIASV
jgi:c-di-GMP-binding flagellar brake protein YcgR